MLAIGVYVLVFGQPLKSDFRGKSPNPTKCVFLLICGNCRYGHFDFCRIFTILVLDMRVRYICMTLGHSSPSHSHVSSAGNEFSPGLDGAFARACLIGTAPVLASQRASAAAAEMCLPG
jgi:hypothetical protein